MSEVYKVQVIKAESGEVVKEIEAANLRAAELIEDVLNINLNHMYFFTSIQEPKQ